MMPNNRSIQPQTEAWTQRREQLLDDALMETFPASDPPAIAMPQDRER